MFTIQELQLFFTSPIGRTFVVFLILITTHYLAKSIKLVIRKHLTKPTFLDMNKTQRVIVRHFAGGLIYLIGLGFAVYTIPSLRTLSVSLFAGAGVLAVIIGFASQQAVSNIISGLFIAFFTPFRVDDVITLREDSILGRVEDINLRHTTIRTFENKRVIIPNAIINNEIITNFDINDERICKYVEFGISYDSNIDLAMKIMCEEAQKHPLCHDNRTKEDIKSKKNKVDVKVLGFGDSAVKLRAWVWAKNPIDAFIMGCDLNKSIKERFDKSGIEIPFPYRTIVYKKEKRQTKTKNTKSLKRRTNSQKV